MTSDENRVIRASEIGEYIYCHRAWWLGHVKGLENANHAEMDAGVMRHRVHGQTIRRAEFFQRAAFVLALLAIGTGTLLLALALGFIR